MLQHPLTTEDTRAALAPIPTSVPPVRGAVCISWTWGSTCQDLQLSADRGQNARNRCGFGHP